MPTAQQARGSSCEAQHVGLRERREGNRTPVQLLVSCFSESRSVLPVFLPFLFCSESELSC